MVQTDTQLVSSFDLLGKRWSALIIQELSGGRRRFRELLSHLAPINDKVLSQRLKELEEAGILNRQVFPEVPIRVEYSLSAKGSTLVGIIREMERWDAQWAQAPSAPPQPTGVRVTIPGFTPSAPSPAGVGSRPAGRFELALAPDPVAPVVAPQAAMPPPVSITAQVERADGPAAQRDDGHDNGRRRFWKRLRL